MDDEGQSRRRKEERQPQPDDPLTPEELREVRALLARERRTRRIEAVLDDVVSEGGGYGPAVIRGFRDGVHSKLREPEEAATVDDATDGELRDMIAEMFRHPFDFLK